MIKQKEIVRYQDNAATAKQLADTVELKRKELIKRLDEGEKVEGGPLDLQVASTSSQRFSADALIGILGAEKVASLKRQLPLTVSRSLRIVSQLFAGTDVE